MALTPEGTPYVESSDLVANYPAASLSLANRVDLVGVLPFATSTARGTAIPTPTDGQYSYLQDTNSTEFYNGSAWQALSAGKIVQLVRATDATIRTTTSTSFVDANISVTITPTKNTSTVLLLWVARAEILGSGANANFRGQMAITDSANTVQSGAQQATYGYVASTNLTDATMYHHIALVGWATPATTSAVTYKGRFRVLAASNTNTIDNQNNTGQLYAIEVAA
jgi:hypothetical protein